MKKLTILLAFIVSLFWLLIIINFPLIWLTIMAAMITYLFLEAKFNPPLFNEEERFWFNYIKSRKEAKRKWKLRL